MVLAEAPGTITTACGGPARPRRGACRPVDLMAADVGVVIRTVAHGRYVVGPIAMVCWVVARFQTSGAERERQRSRKLDQSHGSSSPEFLRGSYARQSRVQAIQGRRELRPGSFASWCCERLGKIVTSDNGMKAQGRRLRALGIRPSAPAAFFAENGVYRGASAAVTQTSIPTACSGARVAPASRGS